MPATFEDNSFDVVINECAVGIPDNSQKVLHEMVRVVKLGGRILIHESTWRVRLSKEEKDEFAERYGNTPLEFEEWRAMLEKAGVNNIVYEFEQWSKPEMFWKIRKDRDVKHWFFTMTIPEDPGSTRAPLPGLASGSDWRSPQEEHPPLDRKTHV